MAINPEIALQVRQPEPVDVLGNYGRAVSIAEAIQGRRMREKQMQMNQQVMDENRQRLQLENDQRRMAAEEQQAIKDVFAKVEGDISKAPGPLRRLGTPTALKYADDIDKSIQEHQKAQYESQINELKLGAEKSARLGQLTASINSQETKDAAIGQALREKLIDPEHGFQLLMRQWDDSMKGEVAQFASQALTAQQQHEQAIKDAQEKRAAEMHPFQVQSAQYNAQAAQQKATGTEPISPYQQAQIDQNKAQLDETKRHNRTTEAATAADVPALSPEGLDAAALAFAKTGQLPAMGMGGKAAAVRTQIINRAAQMNPSLDLAANKAEFHANQGSLAALQKQKDAVDAFEKTAGKNLDQFLQTASKVVDSGSPLLNKPLRFIDEKVAGGADITAFNVARQVAVTEIAKVLANPGLSGQLSDSARKEVQDLIGPDATLRQIYTAAKILKTDMDNRRASMDEQIGAIRNRIGSGGSKGPNKQELRSKYNY